MYNMAVGYWFLYLVPEYVREERTLRSWIYAICFAATIALSCVWIDYSMYVDFFLNVEKVRGN